MAELWLEAIILGVAIWLTTANPLVAAGAALVTLFIGMTAYQSGYGDGALSASRPRGRSGSLVPDYGGTVGDYVPE